MRFCHRPAARAISASPARDKAFSAASLRLSRSKSPTTIPTRSLSSSASVSPIPRLLTTGRPAARYSEILVGEAAICENVGLRNERPSRERHSSPGTSSAGTPLTSKSSFFRPACRKPDAARSADDIVMTRKNAPGHRSLNSKKKRPISSSM